LDDININIGDKAGIVLLLIVVEEKDMEIVKLLLRHKDIDVNTKDQHGEMLLYKAVLGIRR